MRSIPGQLRSIREQQDAQEASFSALPYAGGGHSDTSTGTHPVPDTSNFIWARVSNAPSDVIVKTTAGADCSPARRWQQVFPTEGGCWEARSTSLSGTATQNSAYEINGATFSDNYLTKLWPGAAWMDASGNYQQEWLFDSNCCKSTTLCCCTFDCYPICISVSNIVLRYHGTGSIAYSASPVSVTYYLDSDSCVSNFPPAYLRRVIEEVGDGISFGAVELTPAFYCNPFDPPDPYKVNGFLDLIVRFTSPGSLGNGTTVAAAVPGAIVLNYTSCTIGAFPAPVDIVVEDALNGGDLTATIAVTHGACGVAGERCYKGTCTDFASFKSFCCDGGGSWFGTPRVGLPTSLTATVISSPVPALVGLSETMLRNAFYASSVNATNGIYMQWKKFTSNDYTWRSLNMNGVIGLTCDGTLYQISRNHHYGVYEELIHRSPPGPVPLLPYKKIATISTVHSTTPIDIEVTTIAFDIDDGDNAWAGSTGTVIRIVE